MGLRLRLRVHQHKKGKDCTMETTKRLIVEDFQDAIRDGYQEFLEKFGFISYKDDLIHWYLLRNGVLFSLQIQTPYLRQPIFMQPLFFVNPLFVKTPLTLPLREDREEFLGISVFRLYNEWQFFHRRAPIHYPQGEHFGGAAVQERVESFLHEVQTPKDAFEKRKKFCRTDERIYLTEGFVDEVIYYQDEEFWERAIQTKQNYFSCLAPDADVTKNPYAIRHRAQLRALEDPVARLEYVAELEKKKAAQLAELRKKVPAAVQGKPSKIFLQ